MKKINNKGFYLMIGVVLACLIGAVGVVMPYPAVVKERGMATQVKTAPSFITECEKNGGVCIHLQEECKEGYSVYSFSCATKSQKCCIPFSDTRELDMEINSPGDGETVSGIVRVEATATGSNELGDMYLTITDDTTSQHLQLSECVTGVGEPLCEAGSECWKTYTKTCWYSWDTPGWRGEKVRLTASISDSVGNKAEDSIGVYLHETENLADVSIYPESQTVEVGNPVEYKITVTDNHPIARCGIALADKPTPSTTENVAPRCMVYYTYKLEVTGLPFDAEYPESVTLYQGSSDRVSLTIKPTYNGNFEFKVKATLSSDLSVYDSDSAKLVVGKYRGCNLECRRQGYDYGVCRNSCRENEVGIGTRYCPQIIDETLTQTVSANEGITASEEAKIRSQASETGESNVDIYIYPEYNCCCGYEGINVKAWPGKSSYEPKETATIYAKVYSTEDKDVNAEVTGTVKRPDGEKDTLSFRKICTLYEIQKIKAENPAMEIQCIGGKCWPSCLYVATYENTETGGYYSVTVQAKSTSSLAETSTGFWVREDYKSCNSHCQEIGYDYGVCRTSCRSGEEATDYKYCLQPILDPSGLVDESTIGKGRYQYLNCCCGRLTPPQPPEEKIKLGLQEGWNLITLPGKGELSLGNCDALHGFVYIDGEYLTMKNAEERLGREGLMEYLRKHSFWAYSFKKCELEFKLEEYTPYTGLELSEGWNFMPITADMVGKSLKDMQGNCEFQKTYLWDAKKQGWEEHNVESKFSDEHKFKGLIVKTADSCSLGQDSIPTPPPLPEG